MSIYIETTSPIKNQKIAQARAAQTTEYKTLLTFTRFKQLKGIDYSEIFSLNVYYVTDSHQCSI